jgi:hypothetical protein
LAALAFHPEVQDLAVKEIHSIWSGDTSTFPVSMVSFFVLHVNLTQLQEYNDMSKFRYIMA